MTDQQHNHRPVNRSRRTADHDKAQDATQALPAAAGGTRGLGAWAHGATEHSAAAVADASHASLAQNGGPALCVVVDDFGLSDGVCVAALTLIQQRRVHAIGCQVGAAAWARWSPHARALQPALVDVGLHLDFTETPLRMPAQSLRHLMAASWTRRLDASLVRTEILAQLDAFEQAMGRPPAYVDGHQHVHQFPVVREALLDELLSRYPTALPWLRSTRHAAQPRGVGAQWRAAAKASVIERLGASHFAALVQSRGGQLNERLCGVYDFRGDGHAYLARADAWLRACRTGDLLMCHPAVRDAPGDPIAPARRAEYRALSGADFPALLSRHRVRLEPMSQILGQLQATALAALQDSGFNL